MNAPFRSFASLAEVARLLFELPPGPYRGESAALIGVDTAQNLLGLVCFTASEALAHTVLVNNEPVPPRFVRSFSLSLAREGELFAHILWLPFDASFRSAVLCGPDRNSLPILYDGTELPCLEAAHLHIPKPPPREPLWVYGLSLLCRITGLPRLLRLMGRGKYAGCWLFADRGFMADDNAEHLYRWVMRHHPERNIVFALHKNSPDWPRLAREGFNLVHIGGMEYRSAYLNCAWLISSQRTGYITKHYWRKWHADAARHRFCFLQHGICMNYLPRLNIPHADMFICTTKRECEAFTTDPRFPYVYCGREVRLTGLPRHDELLRKASAVKNPRTILIMPSWRHTMAPGQTGDGQFIYDEGFTQSEFFRRWQAVLQAKRLLDAARKHDYQVRFYPHPHLRPQLRHFQLEGVTLIPEAGVSVQDILAETALLITDYSSIAMEAALLRRPVLHFQFDREAFFSRNRDLSRGQGYFDYERDGLGEVAITEDELFALAERHMREGCRMREEYRRRADAFFAFTDTENCRRVYAALCALEPA